MDTENSNKRMTIEDENVFINEKFSINYTKQKWNCINLLSIINFPMQFLLM